MGINEACPIKNRKKNTFKVWLSAVLLLSSIFSGVFIEHTIEDIKREQARYNLNQIKYCYSELTKLNILTQQKIFGICTNKVRASYTGDVYILDPENLEFVHETSRDVPRNVPLYFTKDSVGKYFKDWDSAKYALNQILLGKNSEYGVNIYYKYDNGIEWLEWIYLPDEASPSKRFIVVQGIQKDEVIKHLTLFRIIVGAFTLLMVMVLLIINNNNNDSKRRTDDCTGDIKSTGKF